MRRNGHTGESTERMILPPGRQRYFGDQFIARNKKTYSGIRVNCPVFCPICNKTFVFSADFHKIPQNKSAQKSVQVQLL